MAANCKANKQKMRALCTEFSPSSSPMIRRLFLRSKCLVRWAICPKLRLLSEGTSQIVHQLSRWKKSDHPGALLTNERDVRRYFCWRNDHSSYSYNHITAFLFLHHCIIPILFCYVTQLTDWLDLDRWDSRYIEITQMIFLVWWRLISLNCTVACVSFTGHVKGIRTR